jgi:hypothetical protein
MRVIELLEWVFSEKVEKYIDQLKYVDFEKLDFKLIDKESSEFIRGRLGYHQYISSDNIHQIGIRPSLPTQVAEFIVCHEIEHIELVYAGFNLGVKPSLDHDSQEYWVDFCTSLQSTFSDIIINKKLKAMGFNFDGVSNGLFDSLKNLKFKKNDPKPVYLINSLRAYSCRYIFGGNRLKECNEIYRKNAFPIYAKSIEINELTKEIGFDTPEKYNAVMRRLVVYFKVENDVILFEQKF